MELLIKICALALVSTCAGMVLRSVNGNLSFAVKIASVVMITGSLVVAVGPVISQIEAMVGGNGKITDYATVVLRALGIALLAQMTAQICRDCGENAAATGVETAGKSEIFVLCVPLITEIIGYAREILELG